MNYAPVSVIIPCYNCGSTIMRAVNSVIRQSLLPRQLILVNDCSDDNKCTTEKLYQIKKQFEKMLEILIINLETNKGAASARNAGWRIATEPYIAFLDADDAWHENKIELQYIWMQEHPEVVLTGHGVKQLKDTDITQLNCGLYSELKAYKVKKTKLLFSNVISTPTAMIKNNIPNHFVEGKRYSEDYLLWLQIVESDYKVYLLNITLAFLFKEAFGRSGLSGRMWNMEKGELETYRILYKNKLIGCGLLHILEGVSLSKYLLRLINVFIRNCKGRLLIYRSGVYE